MKNYLNIGKIDREKVFNELQDLAEKYLTRFQEAYINMFANEAKRIADNALDDFIFSQEEFYTSDTVRRIKDDALLLDFTDVQTGYRRQMQKWIQSNPIEVEIQTISMDDIPNDIPFMEREAIKRTMATFGIGTLVVSGLRFITGTNWIWLAELVTLVASGKSYLSGKELDDQKRKQMQETWFESDKLRIIGDIRHNLELWFDSAEKENARILRTFNLE